MSFYTDNLFGRDSDSCEVRERRADISVKKEDETYETPAGLLEQLGYFESFMKNLDNEFFGFDMILHNEQSSSGNTNEIMGTGLDERLKMEHSAFENDGFIFSECEKPKRIQDLMEQSDSGLGNASKENRVDIDRSMVASRLKTQSNLDRRNIFSSQYKDTDHSILKQDQKQCHGEQENFRTFRPSQKGECDIKESSMSTMQPILSEAVQELVIKLPDFSSISTATIVSTLPQVKVPPGAYRSMIDVGFTREQIDAVAAIMAYHQTKGAEIYGSTLTSIATAASENYFSTNRENSRIQFIESSPTFQHANKNNRVQPGHLKSLFSDQTNHSSLSFELDCLTQTDSYGQLSPNSVADLNSYNVCNKQVIEKSLNMQGEMEGTLDVQTADGNPQKYNQQNTYISVNPDSRIEESDGFSDKPAKNNKSMKGKFIGFQTHNTRNKLSNKSVCNRNQKERLVNPIQELSELANTLKQKIQNLEMENRLLKNMVANKGENESREKFECIRQRLLSKIRNDN